MLTLPLSELPRERFSRYGSEALTSVELLAILLNSGTAKKSVLDLALELMECFGSLEEISEASVEEIAKLDGIGQTRAVQLKAAFALGKRLHRTQEQYFIFDRTEDLAAELHPEMAFRKSEVVMVLLLDVRKRIFHREIIAVGTLTEVLLHPREIFHPAIRRMAHSIILVHNHPSGDPTPSKRDIEVTRVVEEAGRLLGISLLDHLIIAKRGYFSFLEKRGEEKRSQ